MSRFKPHAPPSPEWPDYVVEIYRKGCEKIDRLRQQLDEDGTIPMPFICYLCEDKRMDYAMTNGDGLPMCVKCLGFNPIDFNLAKDPVNV